MSDFALDRIVNRVRENRTARERDLLGERAAALCPEGRMGCSHTPGARVFDRVSGQEGTVLGGTRENVLVSTPQRTDR